MSTEPIVFWGPGSEWFWSMAQFVVVAVTLLGIYYQFRLQRAANAFDQLNRIGEQWESEQMLRARLEVARAVAAGHDAPEAALHLIGNFWEAAASLVRGGHVNARAVSETYGSAAGLWWTAVAATTRKLRAERLDPTIFVNFEWLAARSRADGASAGVPLEYEPDTLRAIFESAIPGMRDRIRMAEESRMLPERRTREARQPTDAKGSRIRDGEA